jgi:hypothetical protein
VVGTQHVEQLVDEQSRVYQAPEVTNPEAPGVLLDAFALGAVAYHILTGRPPATSVAERKGVLDLLGGLDITAVFDAAPSSPVNLVFDATCAVVPSHTKTVARAKPRRRGSARAGGTIRRLRSVNQVAVNAVATAGGRYGGTARRQRERRTVVHHGTHLRGLAAAHVPCLRRGDR